MVVWVGQLFFELFANADILRDVLQEAGAIPAGALEPLADVLHDLGIRIQVKS